MPARMRLAVRSRIWPKALSTIVRAVAGEQLLHALDAEPAGGDLRIEVAAALRRQAHVEEQQVEQLACRARRDDRAA